MRSRSESCHGKDVILSEWFVAVVSESDGGIFGVSCVSCVALCKVFGVCTERCRNSLAAIGDSPWSRHHAVVVIMLQSSCVGIAVVAVSSLSVAGEDSHCGCCSLCHRCRFFSRNKIIVVLKNVLTVRRFVFTMELSSRRHHVLVAVLRPLRK